MHIQLVAHVRGEQACWHATHSPCTQDIKDRTLVHSTAAQRTWENVGSDIKCDHGAGEVYRIQSSNKASDLAACKKSCEDTSGCQSITFFDDSWCSHFSTGCVKTTVQNKAVAMRLIVAQTTTASSTSAGELTLLCHRC